MLQVSAADLGSVRLPLFAGRGGTYISAFPIVIVDWMSFRRGREDWRKWLGRCAGYHWDIVLLWRGRGDLGSKVEEMLGGGSGTGEVADVEGGPDGGPVYNNFAGVSEAHLCALGQMRMGYGCVLAFRQAG